MFSFFSYSCCSFVTVFIKTKLMVADFAVVTAVPVPATVVPAPAVIVAPGSPVPLLPTSTPLVTCLHPSISYVPVSVDPG